MMNNLRTVKSTAIIGLVIISAFMSLSVINDEDSTAKAQIEPFINFNTQLAITHDPTNLNQPIEIDSVLTVPVTVTYSTNIPSDFLKAVPPLIKNSIIYGSMVVVPPIMEFNILETNSTIGDWALVYFDSPSILPEDIPNAGDSVQVKTNLMISPRREAPAEPQKIEISSSIGGVGRLKGQSIRTTISFTPSYIPQIDVFVDSPTRIAGPREPLEFKVEIANKANKITKVKADVVNVPSEWAPVINPTWIELSPNAREEVTFSVVPPYDFGWHDETKSMELKFTPYPSPIPNDYDPTAGQTQSVFLRVNNYGFAISGFEIVILLAIIIIVLIAIYFYKYAK